VSSVKRHLKALRDTDIKIARAESTYAFHKEC